MPRGDKSKYSDKQKRQAEHIEEGYEDRGVSAKEAKSRAWATVNKESGGGEKSAVVVAKRRGIAPHAKAKADSLHAPKQSINWNSGITARSHCPLGFLAGIRTYRRIIKWLTVAVAVLES